MDLAPGWNDGPLRIATNHLVLIVMSFGKRCPFLKWHPGTLQTGISNDDWLISGLKFEYTLSSAHHYWQGAVLSGAICGAMARLPPHPPARHFSKREEKLAQNIERITNKIEIKNTLHLICQE